MIKREHKSLFSFSLILITAFFSISCRQIDENHTTEPSILISPRKGLAWVKECVEKHPEIEYLADAKVDKTEDYGRASASTYSEQLYGASFIEFDRTIMSLHCLRLIIDGNDEAYETFTRDQKNAPLTRESFQEMHLMAIELIENNPFGLTEDQMLDLMTAGLVLSDLGKSKTARELFGPYGAVHPDQDYFYAELIEVLQENPSLCPTFDKLPQKGKDLLLEEYRLHGGHAFHFETGERVFTSIVQSKILEKNSQKFTLHWIKHLADTAAAAGHKNNVSSIIMTENTYQVLRSIYTALFSITSYPELSVTEKEHLIYEELLTNRGKNLGLKADTKEGKLLIIMGSMMRLFGEEKGKMLQEAFSTLDDKEQKALIDAIELRDSFEDTPTYLPAFLSNLYANRALGKTEQKRLDKTFAYAAKILPQIFTLYAEKKESVWNRDKSIVLNFNPMAGFANVENPQVLLVEQWEIDEKSGKILPKDFFPYTQEEI